MQRFRLKTLTIISSFSNQRPAQNVVGLLVQQINIAEYSEPSF